MRADLLSLIERRSPFLPWSRLRVGITTKPVDRPGRVASLAEDRGERAFALQILEQADRYRQLRLAGEARVGPQHRDRRRAAALQHGAPPARQHAVDRRGNRVARPPPPAAIRPAPPLPPRRRGPPPGPAGAPQTSPGEVP